MYVKNLRRWLVPFLRRCEKLSVGSYQSLLHDYLVTMAQEDLSLCRLVFENSKREVSVKTQLLNLVIKLNINLYFYHRFY